jgi:hypothetical protein
VSGPAQGERPDVPHSRAWETKPRFTLCRETAALAVKGWCPVHDSDGCLFEYVQVSALRPECAALEREKAVLEGALREAVEWVVDAADGGDPIAERQLASIRSVLAKDLSKNFGAALSNSSQGQG